MIGLIFLGAAFICFLLWLFLKFSARSKSKKLLQGEIVYCGINNRNARILQAPLFHLSGIPDYIIKQNNKYIPVEIKSSTTPKKLYDSDRMQVVAQALLVEAEYGKLPTYGFVQYPNRTFTVKIKPKYINKLEQALSIMRKAKETGLIPKLYPSWYYCPTCQRTNCPKRRKVERTQVK
jgi:CRISPR/Cas system-associated exonuclease Cas4 (RecB family)